MELKEWLIELANAFETSLDVIESDSRIHISKELANEISQQAKEYAEKL